MALLLDQCHGCCVQEGREGHSTNCDPRPVGAEEWETYTYILFTFIYALALVNLLLCHVSPLLYSDILGVCPY